MNDSDKQTSAWRAVLVEDIVGDMLAGEQMDGSLPGEDEKEPLKSLASFLITEDMGNIPREFSSPDISTYKPKSNPYIARH